LLALGLSSCLLVVRVGSGLREGEQGDDEILKIILVRVSIGKE